VSEKDGAPVELSWPDNRWTIRDCYAAAALQVLIIKNTDPLKYPSAIAGDAYVYADAMLAERERGK